MYTLNALQNIYINTCVKRTLRKKQNNTDIKNPETKVIAQAMEVPKLPESFQNNYGNLKPDAPPQLACEETM